MFGFLCLNLTEGYVLSALPFTCDCPPHGEALHKGNVMWPVTSHFKMVATVLVSNVAVWLSVFWATGIDCKHDHPVPTYFGKLHPNGTIVDARNPANKLRFSFPLKPITTQDSGAVLKVSPSSEIKNGAEVNVMWHGVTFPNKEDVVVLYCPPDAEPERYLDYVNVSTIATYPKGYGEFAVRLWNVRKDCVFRYFRIGNYSMLAVESNIVTFEGGAEMPLQGHLALTGNPTEMRVMWVSGFSKFCNLCIVSE